MALNTVVRLASFASLLFYIVEPNYGQQIFDVTRHGAVADGATDDSDAFLDAWNAACQLGGAGTFFVPRGTFTVSAVVFQGPCAGGQSPRVEIQGTVLAPAGVDSIETIGWIEFRGLSGLTIGGGGVLDGQGAEAWKQVDDTNKHGKKPISLRLIKLKDSRVENIELLNSKGFHMAIHHSDSVHVGNLKITAPGDSPNTDGCHVSDSKHIDITDTKIGTGDDCISIGEGSSNISVSGIVCDPGHGISIGSLGKRPGDKDVVGVTVRNCEVANSHHGVRIKTWPGSRSIVARDMVFEDIVVRNVKDAILIDQRYCPSRKCGGHRPSLVQIDNVLFRNIRGTSSRLQAVRFDCSEDAPCRNVRLEGIGVDYVDEDGVRARPAEFCSNILEDVFGGMKPRPCQ